jgi:3-oxoacyl-[acyl-carrier-protein] synthase III
MKFAAISSVLPSDELTNERIVAKVIEESRDKLSESDCGRLEKGLEYLFSKAGTKVRYVRADGETARELTVRAGQAALKAAGMSPDDIELLIYVGVGRGFLEPSMANLFQDQLEIRRATCFDVLDACASWLRALHIAQAFMRCGLYSRIMILNGEFNFREYANFRFGSIKDLRHNFAIFTVGEAATATILCDAKEDAEYYATFKTWAEFHNLCMIPLPNFREFGGLGIPGHATPFHFYSYSQELFDAGTNKLINHFRQDENINQYYPDIAFGHAASDLAGEKIARECGRSPAVFYHTHSRFANTVSASIPLAMAYAAKEGRLKNDDNVAIGVASAGLTTVWARFRFIS